MASTNPLLLLLVDCPTEALSSRDFGLHVSIYPRFIFFARFCFLDVDCCSRGEYIIVLC